MASTIVGWILVALGVLSYVWALIAFVKSQRPTAQTRTLRSFGDRDLKAVAELLEKISDLLGNFARLSIPVQWALLGLADVGIGAYLLANRPF